VTSFTQERRILARKRATRSNLLQSRRKGARLTKADKEIVIQHFYACGVKSETCRELGISKKALENCLRDGYRDPELQQARNRATEVIEGKLTGATEKIVDSITVDDLTSETIPVYDNDGNLLRYVTRGPSLRDKAFAVGQLTNSSRLIGEARARAKEVEAPSTIGLLLPDTLESSKKMLARQIKRLRLDVEFHDNGEVLHRVEKLRRDALVTEQEVEEADLSGPDPFDGV